MSSHPVKEEYGVQYPDVIITYGVVDTAKLAAKNVRKLCSYSKKVAKCLVVVCESGYEVILAGCVHTNVSIVVCFTSQ